MLGSFLGFGNTIIVENFQCCDKYAYLKEAIIKTVRKTIALIGGQISLLKK